MDPTARFRRVVEGPDDEVRLDEGALSIAAHAYPALDVDAEVARLDALAAGVPEPTLDGVRAHLFDRLGFKGDAEDYDDPRNSYLNDVLDRRLGLPITLSVVTMEVGRRVGVPFSGIGLPGHFVVRHDGSPPVLLDPFDGGREVRVEGELPVYTPRQVLGRMLANLKRRFAATGDAVGTEWVLRLRSMLPEVGLLEVGEWAGALAALGRYRAAAETLEGLAGRLPEDAAARVLARARRFRARLN